MKNSENTNRPLLLNLTAIIAITYYSVMLAFFISGIIFNKFITEAFADYVSGDLQNQNVLVVSLIGSVLYLICISGIILIRKLKKIGLLIYTSVIIVIFLLKISFFNISLLNTIINLAFIGIFTLFFRRFK